MQKKNCDYKSSLVFIEIKLIKILRNYVVNKKLNLLYVTYFLLYCLALSGNKFSYRQKVFSIININLFYCFVNSFFKPISFICKVFRSTKSIVTYIALSHY